MLTPNLNNRGSAMVRIRNSWRWCGPASSWGRTDLTIGGVRGVQLTMLTSMLASCGTQMGGKTKKNPIGWQKRRKTSTKSLSGAEKSGKVNCCISCWFSKPVPMTQSDCFPGDSNLWALGHKISNKVYCISNQNPKFQTKLMKIVQMRAKIVWCVKNHLFLPIF